MPEQLRVLSIGAHPADIFDQSGGTMAHHAIQRARASDHENLQRYSYRIRTD